MDLSPCEVPAPAISQGARPAREQHPLLWVPGAAGAAGYEREGALRNHLEIDAHRSTAVSGGAINPTVGKQVRKRVASCVSSLCLRTAA